MLRETAVCLLLLASCARPPAAEPSSSRRPLDPVDDYILRHLFIGSPDGVSPIGGRGRPIRGADEQWVLIGVWLGRQPEEAAEMTAYVEHTWCYADALRELLDPASPAFDPEFEAAFRRANARANAAVEPTATRAALWKRVDPILQEEGIFRRLADAVDPACPKVTAVPREVRAMDRSARKEPGISGKRSYLGPQEPCALFRYCVLSDEPSLLYDVFSPAKKECYAIHQELLESDAEYRRLYAAEMTPFLEEVAGVPPEEAALFLIRLYQRMQDMEFYRRLVRTYEARHSGVPSDGRSSRLLRGHA